MELHDLTNEAKRDLLWNLAESMGMSDEVDEEDSTSPISTDQLTTETTILVDSNIEADYGFEQIAAGHPVEDRDLLYVVLMLAKAFGFETRVIGPNYL